MKTPKERVQDYVREQIPALTRSLVPRMQLVELLPIHLEDYLAVLGEHSKKLGDYIIDTEYFTFVDDEGYSWLSFSLTDGQPATEKDWEVLANILGV